VQELRHGALSATFEAPTVNTGGAFREQKKWGGLSYPQATPSFPPVARTLLLLFLCTCASFRECAPTCPSDRGGNISGAAHVTLALHLDAAMSGEYV
jgi:hypothetical protein